MFLREVHCLGFPQRGYEKSESDAYSNRWTKMWFSNIWETPQQQVLFYTGVAADIPYVDISQPWYINQNYYQGKIARGYRCFCFWCGWTDLLGLEKPTWKTDKWSNKKKSNMWKKQFSAADSAKLWLRKLNSAVATVVVIWYLLLSCLFDNVVLSADKGRSTAHPGADVAHERWKALLYSSSISRSPSPTVSPGLQWTLLTWEAEETAHTVWTIKHENEIYVFSSIKTIN